jgi:F-type H+-transporting ATPase subunit b
MPQLDPTSFASQLFWLTMSFVALYVLLAHFLLPRVQSVLMLRTQTVQSDIEQAERMKTEAERANDAYEQTLTEARARSQTMLVSAHAEMAERAAKRQAELDASMDKKLGESEAAIRKAKSAVAEKLSPVAGDLASLIVEMLVHQKPDSKDIGTVISDLAKERSL